MKAHNGMRPQDIVLMLKLTIMEGRSWRYVDLTHETGISPGEISEALERCRLAGLIDPDKRKVFKQALLEFLLHGIRYVFPVEPGPITRGIPTAHSAMPLRKKLMPSGEAFVWADDSGTIRGQGIRPLYPTVPKAAKADQELHDLLALVDSLRVGQARERKLAAQELLRRLSCHERVKDA